jgi:hypothetical protein
VPARRVVRAVRRPAGTRPPRTGRLRPRPSRRRGRPRRCRRPRRARAGREPESGRPRCGGAPCRMSCRSSPHRSCHGHTPECCILRPTCARGTASDS